MTPRVEQPGGWSDGGDVTSAHLPLSPNRNRSRFHGFTNRCVRFLPAVGRGKGPVSV
jgi:hypothetical protein